MLKALRLALPLSFLLSAAVLTVSLGAPAQDPPLPGSIPRSQFAPYYTVTQGFRVELMLNNATRAGFDVRPTLYSLDGNAAALSPIHLAGHETKTIDLAGWVAQLGGEYVTGSLRLDYESVGLGLGAMVMMVNEPGSLEVDVLARSQQMFKSTNLEGVWWATDPQTRVQFAVQNTTEMQVTGTLWLTGTQGQQINSVPLSLGAHETRVFNLRELVDPAHASVGGISIRHGAQPGALMAHGFALRPQTGFSANLPFQDPATFGDSKLEGAGVFVGHEGTAPGAPPFSGHLLIRNTSSNPLTASPVLQRGQFQQALAPVQLQPGETREILIPADFLADRPGATGIEIRHTGPPGGLIGYWFSVDPSANLVVETPLRGHAPNLPGSGNNPWSLEGDLSSVLYVKNTGETRAFSVLEIWHAQGEYMIGLKQIPAGETLALDLRRLRDDHIPDVNGRTLPPDLLAGQILWNWRAGPPLIGRVNTMSVSKGIASNMSCSGCCCTPASIQITLQPAAVAGPVGGSAQETATETDTGTCGSPQTFPINPAFLDWNSSNASVASVSAGSISCLSPGNTTVTGSRSDFLLRPIHDVTEECACDQIPVTPTGFSDVTVLQVSVTTADIVSDQIVVSLSPPSQSGTLVVTLQGAGPNQTIFNGTASGGTYNYSFNRTSLAIGQYTAVNATWTVAGAPSVSGSKAVSFYVMGAYRHSQYNSPAESACTGNPAPAYITNSSCVFNSTMLRNDFISQSWLNGSGITINFGEEQNEAFCLSQGPPDASGRSFRPQRIIPSCGSAYSVNNSTVARGDDAPLICGDSVLIVGLGGGTVKTVTDRCPACTGRLQLDNYTTQAACRPGIISDLGNYTTIRLR